MDIHCSQIEKSQGCKSKTAQDKHRVTIGYPLLNLRSHSLMNTDQGHTYFMVLFGKPCKIMYLTLHLCPFMTLQRQMNVKHSSVGSFHNPVGGYGINDVLLNIICVLYMFIILYMIQ